MANETMKPWGHDLKRDPDNNMLVGPDGCHYDTPQAAFYFGVLNFCVCGVPEEVLEHLRDVLRILDARSRESRAQNPRPKYEDSAWAKRTEELDKLLGDGMLYWLTLYWLDSLDLTEHGSTVSGSWLTPEGESVLAMLNSVEDFDGAL